ncbi:MAG: DUF3426 domain-containing protein [Polaromonas sp.]|nr:DUF3426 domain-containing protein [Polaromonas sp.]
MSLITRCPACGTMFKVVADQLKISQGWVRCGQCSEVFDAAAQLQPRDLPASPGFPSSSSSSPEAPYPETPQVPVDAGAYNGFTEAAPARTAGEVAPLSTMLLAPEAVSSPVQETPPAPVSLPEVQVSMPPDMAAEVFVASVNPEADTIVLPAPRQSPGDSESDAADSMGGDAFDHVQEVSFVRNARRDAFWRRPMVRAGLGLAAVVLLTGLLLQMALFQRSALAARQPALHAGLQALCASLNCEIQPLRQIESIVIDSSSFNRIGPDAYRLKVGIKNNGATALAMPSLELTLTDSQDQALMRRILAPEELGAIAGSTLAAGAEFSGSLAIAVSSAAASSLPGAAAASSAPARPASTLRVAGYRVLAFYP